MPSLKGKLSKYKPKKNTGKWIAKKITLKTARAKILRAVLAALYSPPKRKSPWNKKSFSGGSRYRKANASFNLNRALYSRMKRKYK
jgi:hypothetical protein